MSFYVYLLWSVRWSRTYVGHTEDVENRVKRHNSGFVRSTKANRPWRVIHIEEYSTRAEAMEQEALLKSPSGRKWIAEFIEKWQETGLSVPLSMTTARDRVALEAPRTKPA